jgi:major vault protein
MSEVQKRDLVLPPGSYAYMQDVTKGVVKTYTGPTVINPTAQERPVIYDAGTFRAAASLEDAMRISPLAAEGYYVILRNPAKGNKHPEEGSAQPSAEQEIGRTIIVPGPATFALWPGQSAEVVEGHHLRSNQYLLVRVYNEDEARRNWSKAVVKPVDGAEQAAQVASAPPPDLTVGKQLIIRGTEVSFYIPPTGIEVVRDGEHYGREALTLERLEYAILVDENGKKRYEVGPQVVFPLPTERFVEARDDGGRPGKKFRAVELNEIQGLHIKVIADYTEGGVVHRAGDELFITGKDTAIYFPREEHSAIKYDGKAKHFATAIPAGEARYVMNRLTGEIRTVRGQRCCCPIRGTR